MINKILLIRYPLFFNNGMSTLHAFKEMHLPNYINNYKLKSIIIGFFIKKGMKKVALNNFNNGCFLIRKYFHIDAFLLLRLFVSRSISVLSVNKYIFGRKEKYIPRFNYIDKSIKHVLRLLVKEVFNLKNNKLSLNFVEILLRSCLLSNKYLLDNKQLYEISRINKYVMLNGLFKRNKKMKLFRKVR